MRDKFSFFRMFFYIIILSSINYLVSGFLTSDVLLSISRYIQIGVQLFLILYFLCLLRTIAALLGGKIAGYTLRAFIVGPIAILKKDNQWKIQGNHSLLDSFGNCKMYKDLSPYYIDNKYLIYVLAPLVMNIIIIGVLGYLILAGLFIQRNHLIVLHGTFLISVLLLFMFFFLGTNEGGGEIVAIKSLLIDKDMKVWEMIWLDNVLIRHNSMEEIDAVERDRIINLNEIATIESSMEKLYLSGYILTLLFAEMDSFEMAMEFPKKTYQGIRNKQEELVGMGQDIPGRLERMAETNQYHILMLSMTLDDNDLRDNHWLVKKAKIDRKQTTDIHLQGLLTACLNSTKETRKEE